MLFPLLLLHSAPGFVLFSPWGNPEQGYLNEAQNEWQGPESFDLTEAVFFWSYPESSPLSHEGLGGGITWALDPSFCDEMLPTFSEGRDPTARLLGAAFLTCSDLRHAITSAFNTWAMNHEAITFHDVTDQCITAPLLNETGASSPSETGCVEPEIVVQAYAGRGKEAAVTILSSTNLNRRPRLTSGVQLDQGLGLRSAAINVSSGSCWYLDETFCYGFHHLAESGYDVPALMFTVFAVIMFIAIGVLLVLSTRFLLAICVPEKCMPRSNPLLQLEAAAARARRVSLRSLSFARDSAVRRSISFGKCARSSRAGSMSWGRSTRASATSSWGRSSAACRRSVGGGGAHGAGLAASGANQLDEPGADLGDELRVGACRDSDGFGASVGNGIGDCTGNGTDLGVRSSTRHAAAPSTELGASDADGPRSTGATDGDTPGSLTSALAQLINTFVAGGSEAADQRGERGDSKEAADRRAPPSPPPSPPRSPPTTTMAALPLARYSNLSDGDAAELSTQPEGSRPVDQTGRLDASWPIGDSGEERAKHEAWKKQREGALAASLAAYEEGHVRTGSASHGSGGARAALDDEPSSRNPANSSRWTLAMVFVAQEVPMTSILACVFALILAPTFYFSFFLPCWNCYDFEASMAHEIGHALGLHHPDNLAHRNVELSSTLEGDACERPLQHVALRPPDLEKATIMTSVTVHHVRTCLTRDDYVALHALYPTCDVDRLVEGEPLCVKSRQVVGYLRLTLAVAFPYLVTTVLMILAQQLVRRHYRRRLQRLELDVEQLRAAGRKSAMQQRRLEHALEETEEQRGHLEDDLRRVSCSADAFKLAADDAQARADGAMLLAEVERQRAVSLEQQLADLGVTAAAPSGAAHSRREAPDEALRSSGARRPSARHDATHGPAPLSARTASLSACAAALSARAAQGFGLLSHRGRTSGRSMSRAAAERTTASSAGCGSSRRNSGQFSARARVASTSSGSTDECLASATSTASVKRQMAEALDRCEGASSFRATEEMKARLYGEPTPPPESHIHATIDEAIDEDEAAVSFREPATTEPTTNALTCASGALPPPIRSAAAQQLARRDSGTAVSSVLDGAVFGPRTLSRKRNPKGGLPPLPTSASRAVDTTSCSRSGTGAGAAAGAGELSSRSVQISSRLAGLFSNRPRPLVREQSASSGGGAESLSQGAHGTPTALCASRRIQTVVRPPGPPLASASQREQPGRRWAPLRIQTWESGARDERDSEPETSCRIDESSETELLAWSMGIAEAPVRCASRPTPIRESPLREAAEVRRLDGSDAAEGEPLFAAQSRLMA